jgi:hypothetical protein
MFASQIIKDEAYIQVLKQLKDHKDYDKSIRVWNLFAIIASCFAPSKDLFYSILHYLFFEIKNNKDKNIVNHANYVFVRLYKIFEQRRINLPSENELIHIEHMHPIVISIHFFNDTSTNIEIESYTTVKEVKNIVMKKLDFNVSRIPYYCLYEICNKKNTLEERYLEEFEKISDILSLWEKEKVEACNKADPEPIEFKVYLKVLIYYPYSETEVDTVTIIYTECTFDVTSGKYNLKEQDIITLAALQLLVDFSTNQDEAHRSLQKNIEKFIPINQFNLNPIDYWIQKIMELYSGLKSSSKLEAKLTYLEQLRGSHLWEAHQFDSKVHNLYNK